MKTEYLTENPEWVHFYPRFSSSFYVEMAGYFDERPQVTTSITQLVMLFALPFLAIQSFWFLLMIPLVFFGWGELYVNLPIRTGVQDCESAAWGFNYHDDMIWIYVGGAGNFEGGRKWKAIKMPWSMEWVRTSTLMKTMHSGFTTTAPLAQNEWHHETPKNRRRWAGEDEGSYDWLKKNRWQETHLFIDKYDGTTVNATIGVSEMEWRPLWFQWTGLFKRVRKSINIDFDKEVGERKGSWKGGTVGCGYNLLPNETPLECLKRMERDRKF